MGKPKGKAVHISTTHIKSDGPVTQSCIALLDDGTIWESLYDEQVDKWGDWTQLPSLGFDMKGGK